MFTFGVGYDVNSRLARQAGPAKASGKASTCGPNENIEDRVSACTGGSSAPVLTDLSIKWDVEGVESDSGKPVNRVYPKDPLDLFAGEQLVIVGRYHKPGDGKVVINGTRRRQEGEIRLPRQVRREEQRREHGLHRETVGRPPRSARFSTSWT